MRITAGAADARAIATLGIRVNTNLEISIFFEHWLEILSVGAVNSCQAIPIECSDVERETTDQEKHSLNHNCLARWPLSRRSPAQHAPSSQACRQVSGSC